MVLGNKKSGLRNLMLGRFFVPVAILVFGFCKSPEGPGVGRLRREVLEFARDHADIESRREWKDVYWDVVADYEDVGSYHRDMELNRTPGKKYEDREDRWAWDDSSNRVTFASMRSELR